MNARFKPDPWTSRYLTLGDAEETLKSLGFTLKPGTCAWFDERGNSAGCYTIEEDGITTGYRIGYKLATFDGGKEPMRAIRDLVVLCELTIGARHGGEDGEEAILQRARDGFAALRKMFGDTRPADQIADAAMVEPKNLRAALQITAAVLQTAAQKLPLGEQHCVRFTGKWQSMPMITVRHALDLADAALAGDVLTPEIA